MSRLYSYVVVRDFGFAPNPFSGSCTLATCKPKIRGNASLGDWVIGVGAVSKGRQGDLIYAMKVAEALSFDEYWNDPRFEVKRPVLNGSLKRAYGDNIYHRKAGRWIQADSHHSFQGGRTNSENLRRDVSADRVLIADYFYYFGDRRVVVPMSARRQGRHDLCRPGRGHIVNIPESLRDSFLAWLMSNHAAGVQGQPAQWKGAF
ncbi:hypothetical protein VDF13_06855 [Xanthomonas campestris pv. raphani]|uniref:Nmad2 family putative nucleotide modification protein n=1 Tax=Xanthomonas campestris TaxID=339 RepID=UPI001E3FB063|nr:hypothetical protein [Xanthomonas campestris]MCC8488134.1 hypothetical protein [Xanthomonas campestris]MEA9649890.1 hypothetical protein [Xanthomonas campestris pv. raphani]MEA9743449.1 hypothetical protein [Xanthomonas campestris pv. raphani]MEA9767057.1 hypothetical protein [Xanthomonas campestris pv. raphani]MEA9868305.1 hypothetical protein [Xanthomonas campestris pv. raphani]